MADSVNRGLTKTGIKKLVRQFVQGAVRAQKAGCDGVELHAAHGYLIQQFLSPNTNHRNDEYGGSLENRMRFLNEIIDGIRLAVPSQVRNGMNFKIEKNLILDEEKAQEFRLTLSKRNKNIPLLIEFLKQNGKYKSSLISKMFGSNNVKILLENQVLLLEEAKL